MNMLVPLGAHFFIFFDFNFTIDPHYEKIIFLHPASFCHQLFL